jgi:Flp pilus assembly pilin Flp
MLRNFSTARAGLRSRVGTHVREDQDGRGMVKYVLIVVLIALVVITIVKTRQGEWFSFR